MSFTVSWIQASLRAGGGAASAAEGRGRGAMVIDVAMAVVPTPFRKVRREIASGFFCCSLCSCGSFSSLAMFSPFSWLVV